MNNILFIHYLNNFFSLIITELVKKPDKKSAIVAKLA